MADPKKNSEKEMETSVSAQHNRAYTFDGLVKEQSQQSETSELNISEYNTASKPKRTAIGPSPDKKDLVNDHGESDNEEEDFDLLVKRRHKKKKRKAKTPFPIDIGLTPPLKTHQPNIWEQETPNVRALDYLREEEEICHDFDFEDNDTQDDDTKTKAAAENQLKTNEAALEAEKESDMITLLEKVKARWDARVIDVQNDVAKLKAERLLQEENQRVQLATYVKNYLAEKEKKIDDWFAEQKKNVDVKLHKHQEEAQKGQVNQDNIMEWNTFVSQLQVHHQQQMKRLEEIRDKKKLEENANAQKTHQDQVILLMEHQKRQQNRARLDTRSKFEKKRLEHEEERATLLKRHADRFEKKLLELRSDPGSGSDAVSKTVQYNGTSISSLCDSLICHHAVTWHKRRKICTNHASFGMSIEVHNEGLIIMTKHSDPEHSNDISSARKSNLFLPWGVKARKLLYSVMCGEIPFSPEHNFNNLRRSGHKDLDGGMLRCMITDMRTSEDTATCHRAEAYVNHFVKKNGDEIDHLTKQQSVLRKQITMITDECKKLVQLEEGFVNAENEAIAAHNRSRDIWTMFKAQARQFFNNDGSFSTTISKDNKEKLLNAMRRYKEDFEITKNQLIAANSQLESARIAKVTKQMELKKVKEQAANTDVILKSLIKRASSQRLLNPSEGSNGERVDNIVTVIKNVAERRRSTVNRKKISGNMCVEWAPKVEGLEVDISTKKSIWQKMQRRCLNTLLRPSYQSIVQNLVNKSNLSSKDSDCFDVGQSDTTVNSSLRMEELLLLALHPEAPIGFSPAPESEPGWHVYLEPPQERDPNSILHVDKSSLVPQSLLSFCCSTGRQTASFLRPYHLRTLDTSQPLSFVTKASFLAETNLTNQDKATPEIMNRDPLTRAPEESELEYMFVVQDPSEEESLNRTDRATKKSTSKEQHSSTSERAEIKTNPNREKLSSRGSETSHNTSRADSTLLLQQGQQPLTIPPVDTSMNQMQQTQLGQQLIEPSRFLDANKQIATNLSNNQNELLRNMYTMQQQNQQQLQNQNQHQIPLHLFEAQQQGLSMQQPQMVQFMNQGNSMAQLMQQNAVENNAQMQNATQFQGFGQSTFQQPPGYRKG